MRETTKEKLRQYRKGKNYEEIFGIERADEERLKHSKPHKNGIRNDNRLENLELVIIKKHFGKVRCPYCLKEFLIK